MRQNRLGQRWVSCSRHPPLAKPALAVVALSGFVSAWNDYLGR